MRFSILAKNERILVRGAAVFLLAGMAAGCSSQVSRFGGVDDIFTASTPNQRQIIRPSQPFPGDTEVAPLASAETAPVSRTALTPVSSQPLPPPVQSAPAVAQAPIASHATSTTLASAAPVERTSTGTLKAPASTSDGHLQVADARPSAGSKPEMPGKAPLPSAPSGQLAVLPQAPKLKEGEGTSSAAAPASRDPKASGAGTYTVQEGDTLSKIAKKTGVSAVALKSANGLNDGIVRVGQTLQIPAGGTTAVAAAKPDPVVTASAGPTKTAGETSTVAAYTPPRKSEKLIDQVEQDAAVAPDSTGIGKMRWPVRGRVVSGYGKGGGKANDGIDIQVPEGTPVKAAENGVVIYAGDGLKEFGNTVLVRHEDGLVTVYGHASELKVARGEKVKRGQEIALSGMSGNTDSPKLHFEVRKNSTPVNPSGYLE
ncbi:peptidoglycan DD-metalloendopeptidase family protein [Mesorhizobium sp. KR1-2]|uniref:peptidoglycan DD-metalloendopeptidase family protein n=1 Tax=Mesorhizobium sp. KR1-2 TaxID=3156609 RepID=UPI0032B413BE